MMEARLQRIINVMTHDKIAVTVEKALNVGKTPRLGDILTTQSFRPIIMNAAFM